MSKSKKKVIIFTTNDSIFTIPLVYHICKNNNLYLFEIFIMKGNLLRKIKVLFVLILYGSIFSLFKKYFKKVTVKDLESLENVKLVNNFDKKNYNFGLSVSYTKKLRLQKYKIYNFHLGNFNYQRGSFIFFYKFKYSWNTLDLTFHEITKRFDSGIVLNKKRIMNVNKMNAVDVLSLYLNNLRFLDQSFNKIGKKLRFKKIKKISKLNTIPKIKEIFQEYLKANL